MARKTIERVTRPSLIEVISRRVSDHRIVLMWLATLVVVAVLLCFGWLFIVYPDSNGPRSTRSELVIEVEPGTSLKELASRLQAEQVIADAPLWTLYMRMRGLDRHLRTGSVRFPLPVTPELAARYATTGLGRIQIPILIPEGFNRYEIAARLEEFGICDREDFIEATEDASLLASYGIEAYSAEGYLFPDTYDFADRTKARRVVERMLANWSRHYEALRDEHGEGMAMLKGWTTHDIVTLASIVEEEAAVAVERPRIAGVFLNRLRSKKFLPRRRLQADPTVSYGCVVEPEAAQSCEGFNGDITRAMLEDGDNRYNTYRHSGLPPGPITNPGEAALLAVIEPERHGYFYFVAKGEGRHAFSRTLGEHNRAMREHLQ